MKTLTTPTRRTLFRHRAKSWHAVRSGILVSGEPRSTQKTAGIPPTLCTIAGTPSRSRQSRGKRKKEKKKKILHPHLHKIHQLPQKICHFSPTDDRDEGSTSGEHAPSSATTRPSFTLRVGTINQVLSDVVPTRAPKPIHLTYMHHAYTTASSCLTPRERR